ncbi:unnamed protein product, partial [marine sediment metagenome]
MVPLKDKRFAYVISDISEKTIKIIFKLTKLLVLFSDIETTLIGEIEKKPIDEAKKMLIEWFIKDQIKVGGGVLKASIILNLDPLTCQELRFPFWIEYRSSGEDYGEVVAEIYSSQVIKKGDKEIQPFMVKITGTIKKVWVGLGFYYEWIEGPYIDIIFNEPVQEFEFREPGFFDKLKSSLNKAEIILGKIMDFVGIEDAWNKVKSFLSKISPFTATVAPGPSSFENLLPEEKLASKVEEIIEKEEELSELVEEIETIPEASSGAEGMGLAETQE